VFGRVSDEIDEMVHERRRQALTELRHRNSNLIDRRIASIDAFFQSRLHRIAMDQESVTDTRIVRMRSAERDRVQSEFEARRSALESRRNADIVSDRVAFGILHIQEVIVNANRL